MSKKKSKKTKSVKSASKKKATKNVKKQVDLLDASLGTDKDRESGLQWLTKEERRDKAASKRIAKKPPVKVKRVDSPDDDSAIKVNSNDKKVQTKLVIKDGMVIVEPVFNPFDE